MGTLAWKYDTLTIFNKYGVSYQQQNLIEEYRHMKIDDVLLYDLKIN